MWDCLVKAQQENTTYQAAVRPPMVTRNVCFRTSKFIRAQVGVGQEVSLSKKSVRK